MDPHFKCGVCQKVLSKSNLLEHLETHSEKKPFLCDVCKKTFMEERDYILHLDSHSAGKSFTCHVCLKEFVSESFLCEHILLCDSQKEKYKCDTCGKIFPVKHRLDYHIRVHTKEKSYKCHICAKAFSFKHFLNRHLQAHKRTKFVCNVCHKDFDDKGNFESHFRTHSGEKPFNYDFCQESLSQKGQLKTHFLIHTEERPFQCDVCQKSFKQKCHLKDHFLIVHLGEKAFQCDNCGKKFSKISNLKAHLEVCSSMKHFKNDKCEKSIKLEHDLTANRLPRCQDDKNLVCSLCQREFLNKPGLRVHFQTHFGKKPYTCPFCPVALSRIDDMQTHIRTHLQENQTLLMENGEKKEF